MNEVSRRLEIKISEKLKLKVDNLNKAFKEFQKTLEEIKKL